MSDKEEMLDTESGDFSASEDDWLPDKTTQSSSDDEKDFEDVSSRSEKTQKTIKRGNTRIPKSVPPFKKLAKSAPKKSTVHDNDSDSSGDDCLVDPSQLDFNSDFFAAGTSKAQKNSASVTVSKNIPMNKSKLSDSEDDDTDIVNGNPVRTFDENEQFIRNLERYKLELQTNTSAASKTDTNSSASTSNATFDISKLLQMGESNPTVVPSTSKTSKKISKPKSSASAPDQKHSDNSDWEEVAESKQNMQRDEVVTIRVGPVMKPKPNRTQLELEAQLKRALNRRRKEMQLMAHKVHVLCWIGHGNYVNAVLNQPALMQMCLKFMPSKYTYPKERTDRSYFEQITKWYASQMKLKHNQANAQITRLPSLPISLALQIKAKEAISKKAFVQIFIILLRAIGVPCRLVLNLATMPLRPPSSELCSLSLKPKPTNEAVETITIKNGEKTEKSPTSRSESSKTISNQSKSPATDARKKTSVSSETKTLRQKAKPSNVSPFFATNAKSTVNQPKAQSISETIGRQNNSTKQKNTKSTKSLSKKSNNEPNNKPVSEVDFQKTKTSSAVSSENKSDPSLSKDSKPTKQPARASTASTASTTSTTRKTVQFLTKTTDSPHFQRTTTANIPFSSPIAKRTRSRPQRDATIPRFPPQLDGADDVLSRRKRTSKMASRSNSNDLSLSDTNDDSDFECVPNKKKVTASKGGKRTSATAKLKPKKKSAPGIDRRLLSSDNDDDADEAFDAQIKTGMDMWVELYSEAEDQWMCVDLFKKKVHCVDAIRAAATKPLRYVLAWSEERTIRDVSARYCTNWNTTTRLQRVEGDWLTEALRCYLPVPTIRTRTEDLELDKLHEREPLPKTIGEFKNHPLYALQRHLLKFEGIYPPDAPALGFIRHEQVYARECVHTLHSREIWLKSALVVRPGESAYKVVKARPRCDRVTNRCLEPQPLEIFGHWQTQPYDPPTAENGMVPRNAYGNVELFKPEMLPKKTRHLQLPGLNRTCKKMKIDCAQAVVGFDFHSGSCHPTFDGFVVCEEFAEQVVEQYWLDQEEAKRKEDEKYEARVYGNWKRLIKGLLIRQRLQRKYNFADDGKKAKPTASRRT